MFGTNTASPFGGANASTFGGNIPSSTFGANTSFGGNNSSTFGGNNTLGNIPSSFGGNNASTFGGNNVSAFGGNSGSMFGGNSGSLFGGATTSSTLGGNMNTMFGGNAPLSTFGVNTGSTASTFGGPGGSMFGGNTGYSFGGINSTVGSMGRPSGGAGSFHSQGGFSTAAAQPPYALKISSLKERLQNFRESTNAVYTDDDRNNNRAPLDGIPVEVNINNIDDHFSRQEKVREELRRNLDSLKVKLEKRREKQNDYVKEFNNGRVVIEKNIPKLADIWKERIRLDHGDADLSPEEYQTSRLIGHLKNDAEQLKNRTEKLKSAWQSYTNSTNDNDGNETHSRISIDASDDMAQLVSFLTVQFAALERINDEMIELDKALLNVEF